jgi:hypothetical protein
VINRIPLQSEKLDKLIEARIQFDKLIASNPIAKDAKGNRGSYTSIEALQEGTIPLLNEVGLTMKQTTIVSGENEYLVTTLRHRSDQFETSVAYLYKHEPQMDGDLAKVCGAIMTYIQRYQWRSMLCLGRGSADIETMSISPCIDRRQQDALNQLIKNNNAVKNEVLSLFKIQYIKDLRKENYDQAKEVIEALLAQ